jgi:hypothetical protein
MFEFPPVDAVMRQVRLGILVGTTHLLDLARVGYAVGSCFRVAATTTC